MASVADQGLPRRRASSLAEHYPGRRSHRPHETSGQEHKTRDRGNTLPRRGASLRERYPGDMSHRPLDILRREHRVADRAPHLRTHNRRQPSDVIDALDLTGPVPGVSYHHSGPFDAVLAFRNIDKKYSPLEAVNDSTMEALKATPIEYVQDSLLKHVPLQGTAVVPPGMKDLAGRTMEYQEGTDLMRDEDAPGGPYKRWEHVRYRDDDLKGKGEPSFSVDQARREEKARSRQQQASAATVPSPYEPSARRGGGDDRHREGGTRVRQRGASNVEQTRAGVDDYDDDDDDNASESSGLRRRNTTDKSFTQSLRRRLGSLKKKKASEVTGF